MKRNNPRASLRLGVVSKAMCDGPISTMAPTEFTHANARDMQRVRNMCVADLSSLTEHILSRVRHNVCQYEVSLVPGMLAAMQVSCLWAVAAPQDEGGAWRTDVTK